jgi:hypothetical protein
MPFNSKVCLTQLNPSAPHDDILVCPKCGCEYLHQFSVEVWTRRNKDDDEGVHTDVTLSCTYSDQSMAKNPSPHSDGIEISFMCEQCHMHGDEKDKLHVLRIIQHTSCTLIQWVNKDEEHEVDADGGDE